MFVFTFLGLPPFFGGIALAPVQVLVGGSPAALLIAPLLGPAPISALLFL